MVVVGMKWRRPRNAGRNCETTVWNRGCEEQVEDAGDEASNQDGRQESEKKGRKGMESV